MELLQQGRRMWQRGLGFAMLAAVAAGAPGCGNNGVSGVRVIHLSPANAAIDAFVSDDQVATNLPYGTATPYMQEPSGAHTVSLTLNGADSTVLEKATQDLINLSDYTIIAVNPGTGIGQLFLLDNNTAPAANDYKLRIVNASPTAGVVDVYVTAPSTSIDTVPATLRNVAYQSASAYLQLATASYEVRFTAPGEKTVLADTAALTPAAGDVDTVALADAPPGGTPLQAYQFIDAQSSNGTTPVVSTVKR